VDIDRKYDEIRTFCLEKANPDIVKKYSRYFTEGYDAYGLDRETYEARRDRWIEEWQGDMDLDAYFKLGDRLVSTGKYEEASFAIAFIASRKEEYKKKHFDHLGKWLDHGILNWAHTDILSGKVIPEFIIKNIIDLKAFEKWLQSDSKWQRRAVPVTLIELLKEDMPIGEFLDLIDPVMGDDDKFVQKGLGWFLRESWKKYPEPVETFLMKWKDACGRTIIQYATEKMDKEYRLKFRKSKK